MGTLAWILVGLVAGWTARVLSPGLEPGGFLTTLLVGLLGAFLGGTLFRMMGVSTAPGFNLSALATATLGAMICLVLWRSVAGTRVV